MLSKDGGKCNKPMRLHCCGEMDIVRGHPKRERTKQITIAHPLQDNIHKVLRLKKSGKYKLAFFKSIAI